MSDDFDLNLFYERMLNVDRGHRKKEAEFERLRIEPSARTPAVGDTVVVAAGLIGRGFDWVRKEALVVAVGETSVKVRFSNRRYNGEADEEWVSPVLITDVLPRGPGAEL
jgi:preprotein translocase subunit YajC